MTNGEKFRTAVERASAYSEYCSSRHCIECELNNQNRDYCVDVCMAFWLDLETENEKPLPCPFCGGSMTERFFAGKTKCIGKCKCGYETSSFASVDDAIAAHNRVARGA